MPNFGEAAKKCLDPTVSGIPAGGRLASLSAFEHLSEYTPLLVWEHSLSPNLELCALSISQNAVGQPAGSMAVGATSARNNIYYWDRPVNTELLRTPCILSVLRFEVAYDGISV